MARTLQDIAQNPRHLGARLGFFAILHTWGQTLVHHPHVHCAVPAGGLAEDGTIWRPCRPGFFLPVRVLSRLFRGKFLAQLYEAYQDGRLLFFGDLAPLQSTAAFGRYLQRARSTERVVYAKPPFDGPRPVLAYLARYTHRVAISNHRLLHVDDHGVTFRHKDYRSRRARSLTLTLEEFTRRFLLHILPRGFVRIRYYGFLSHRRRAELLASCRKALDAPPPLSEPSDGKSFESAETPVHEPASPTRVPCPICGRGFLQCIELLSRPPPNARCSHVLCWTSAFARRSRDRSVPDSPPGRPRALAGMRAPPSRPRPAHCSRLRALTSAT